MTLKISLLGPAQISRNDQPVEISGHKPLALLAYLLLTGRAHSRQHLSDLLFDGPDDPRAALRWTLSKLRGAIGVDYIVADRQEIAFNFDQAYWLDVTAFEAGQTDLYRGDFLEGLAVREAPGFEEWLFFERERLRNRYQTTLTDKLVTAERNGDDRTVIDIGHQLLRLDNLREAWHRAVMAAYARSGQREAALAQFERCQQFLADGLDVEPADETTALYEQIRSGTLATRRPASVPLPDSPPKLPAFLDETTEIVAERPLFVARERELAELAERLRAALDGQGRVLFVTGEAGRGKTALMGEFASRAQNSHPDLIVAGGACNAYSGLGDPYLPFREIMGLLSGDVEARWAAGTISRDHARRLWNLLPHTVQALLDNGPNLVDLFLSGPALVNRAEMSASGGAGWLESLRRLAARGQPAPGNLEQHQFFEQYTQVLRSLAGRQPLLLLLDDLQWADSASISLLFHLGRRLTGSPILIVGAYRPSDVVVDHPDSQRHPLEPALNEFKRLFGEIELDLGKAPPAEGRAFVEALLDSEPNHLGESFRAALFRQAQGHPLFTVELLREMQERGDLVQDGAGYWIEGPTLDWERLPTRVEAVIEQRLGRLDDQQRDILTTASVEGELFTVQIVARLQEMEERQLLRQLSRQLEQRHRLVQERDELELGDRRISRFQFRHVLFRQYLYDQLSRGERRLLHQDIAAVLEELYEGRTDEVTVQLARHYTEAGQGEKAIPHLLRAGDQARLAYAHEAASEHYRQAVTFLKEQGDDERTVDTLMKLGLTYHSAFDFEQSRQAYDEAFALRQETGKPESVSPTPPAPHVLTWMLDFPVLTLDPALSDDTTSSAIIEQIFAGLVEQGPEMEILPGVAKSWEILDGGRKYVFHLRDNVYWSDGTRVTAADFEFSWKRVLNPATGASDANLLYDIKGAWAFHQGHLSNPDEVGVWVRDDVTLVVELEQPVGYFLQIVALPKCFPVPRQAIEQHGEAWTRPGNIIGNGPFLLESWIPNQLMAFSRNPGYSGRTAGNVQRVELAFQTEYSSKSLTRYEADQVDVVTLVEPQVSYVRRQYANEYVSLPGSTTGFIAYNQNQPPFNDLRVRRAFALAFDREELAKSHLGDPLFMATGGFVPAGMPGHSPGIGLPCNRNLARQMLAEAGYPDGRGFPPISGLGPAMADYYEGILQQWETHLGVQISWQQLKLEELFERLDSNPPHIFTAGWAADYPDPDSFLRIGIKPDSPRIGWRSETYDALITKARGLINQQARMKLYQQADKILMEDAVIVPFMYRRQHLLVKPWIKNISISPLGNHSWKDIIIDSSRQPVRAQPTSPLPQEPQILRIGGGIQPPTLDWAKFEDDNLDILAYQVFSRLVKLTPDMVLAPDLALRWEILEGGQKYIFHLRPDAFWSDGVLVTAGDFEYAWKRMLDPATTVDNVQLLYNIKGARAFHHGELSDVGQIGVYALDDLTLVVELEQPAGYFLYLLTCTIASPAPRHVAAAFPDTWTEAGRIVTNGPFQISGWDSGGRVRLSRNPTYHGRFSGNVAQLEFVGREDPSAAIELFAAGELDIVNFPVPQLEQVLQKYSGNYVSAPALVTFLVDFDVNRPPFNDPQIRRAFALAIDKSRLVKEITQGKAAPATGGLVPAGMPGHSVDIGLPYNPDRARQLLAEAGYPGGKNFPPVDFLIWPRQAPTAEFLVARWREILGVNVRLEVVAWADVFDRKERKPAHLHFFGWLSNYPDPDDFLRVAFSTGIRWRNEDYDRLVAKAGQMMDRQERLALYRQADKLLIDEAAILPLTYPPWHLLVKPWVKNLLQSPAGWWQFEDVVSESTRQPNQSKPTVAPLSHSRTLRLPLYTPTTLDPTMADDWSIQDQLFSGLVEEGPDLEILPDVAQSWEILDGGRRYVFHLRPDVYWTDGRQVTAADFAYAWKRILDPATGASLAGLLYDVKGAKAFHQGETPDGNQVGVRAVDDVTLEVKLGAPVSYFLHLVARCDTFPVPRHVIAAYGEEWTAAEYIVTNGPFRVESWNWGEAAVLTRNPAYHGRFIGNVERIELDLSPWDIAANLRQYEATRIDLFYASFSSPEMEGLRQQYGGEYVSLPWQQTTYIGFDAGRPPFDDVRVRRAFALAIDRTRLVNLISGGAVPAAGGFIPAGLPGHSPDIALPYDPTQARQLLAEAGYPGGHGFPQVNWLVLTWQPMAEYLRRQWHENLGVVLAPGEIVHMANFSDRFQQESPPLFLGGWVADYPDPDSFLRVGIFESDQQTSGWQNDAYTGLVEKARRVLDQETRLNLYRQADKILVEEAALIPLTYGRGHLLRKPWVKRYPTSPAKWWFWKDVIIEPPPG